MKSFGRLLMAAALIVPAAGIATAAHAGAATPDNVTCTTNTGTIKASTGVSLTTRRGTTWSGSKGTLDSCTGVGISDSTSATLSFTVQRSAVSCKNIKGSLFIGSGQIKWGDGSNAGVTNTVKINVFFASLTQIKFSGIVTGGFTKIQGKTARVGSGYLRGQKLAGTASIPPNLRSAGDNGGTCGNAKTSRVKKLDYTNTSDFTIGAAAAS
jgi:hypothetical protein